MAWNWNLPDDWGCYYTTCENGHRYHMSEGGCDRCEESEEESEDSERESSTTKVVTARKARHVGTSQEIRPGDRVRVTSGFYYEVDGPRLGYFRRYQRLTKGPRWPKLVEQPPAPTYDIPF